MQIIFTLGTSLDHTAQGALPGALDVGGLTLAQRALRSAQLAGVTHAMILTEHGELPRPLRHDRIIQTMTCQVIEAPGASLDALDSAMLTDLPGLQEEFILMSGDRVLTPALLKELARAPEAVVLYDAHGEAIAARLTPGHLEAIDVRGSLDALCEALHVARRTVDSPELMRVRTPEQALAAKRELLKTLRKPLTRNGDGLTAYLINRPISLSISKLLLKTPTTPNHVTFFNLLLGIYAGFMLASGEAMGIALGALLMQMVSIFDGIDGELARMKLLQSPFGAWFDTVSDDVVRIATIVGLGISCYKISPDPVYLWAMAAGCFAILSTVFTLYRDLMQDANVSLNSAKWFFEEEGRKPGLWQSFLVLLSFALKRDTYTLLLMVVAAVGMPQLALFLMIAGICIITTTHFIQKFVRVLKGSQEEPAMAEEMSRA